MGKKSLAEIEEEVKGLKAVNQEFFLDGLGEYLRAFVKCCLEETVKGELTDARFHEHKVFGV